MAESPHLCPATPYALRSHTDRVITEAGPLYHACRYIASNQVPVVADQFGEQVYAAAAAFYTVFGCALETYPSPDERGRWPVTRVREATENVVPLVERARAVAADLVQYEKGHPAE
jgi:hypothetical protein